MKVPLGPRVRPVLSLVAGAVCLDPIFYSTLQDGYFSNVSCSFASFPHGAPQRWPKPGLGFSSHVSHSSSVSSRVLSRGSSSLLSLFLFLAQQGAPGRSGTFPTGGKKLPFLPYSPRAPSTRRFCSANVRAFPRPSTPRLSADVAWVPRNLTQP